MTHSPERALGGDDAPGEARRVSFSFCSWKMFSRMAWSGKALGGRGPTAAAECALLTIKKNLAKPNDLFQLLQLTDIVIQLLTQALSDSISGLTWLGVRAHFAKSSHLLQLLHATQLSKASRSQQVQ